MDIKIYSKLAGQYLSNSQISMKLLKKAYADFRRIRGGKEKDLNNKIDGNTVFFLKGYGNDVPLISSLKQMMFSSRELIDSLLVFLNKLPSKEGRQFSRSFLPFSKSLMAGEYDIFNLDIINFLKNQFTYLFHIRKIRNEIKNNISNVKFRFVTDHIEAYFKVPIKNDEKELIEFLDIRNKEDAVRRESYHISINLDKYFLEMIDFWNVIHKKLSETNNYGRT